MDNIPRNGLGCGHYSVGGSRAMKLIFEVNTLLLLILLHELRRNSRPARALKLAYSEQALLRTDPIRSAPHVILI